MDHLTKAATTIKAWGAKSPLGDPRSLGSSLVFHAALLLLASAAALGVAVSREEDAGPKAIRAELDPVDNRADAKEAEGGGSPGEAGDRISGALETLNSPGARDANAG